MSTRPAQYERHKQAATATIAEPEVLPITAPFRVFHIGDMEIKGRWEGKSDTQVKAELQQKYTKQPAVWTDEERKAEYIGNSTIHKRHVSRQ